MESDRFVGRRAELEELRAAIDSSVQGRGSLFLIAGEPGIGKTRLIEAAAEHATAAGVDVRWASCWEGPTAPFWPWTQLLRGSVQAQPGQGVAEALGGAAADLLSGTDTHAEACRGGTRPAGAGRRDLSAHASAVRRPPRAPRDRCALAYALSALCDATAGPADCEARLARAGEIVELARGDGDRPMELLGRRLRLVAYLEMGDIGGAGAEAIPTARSAWSL